MKKNKAQEIAIHIIVLCVSIYFCLYYLSINCAPKIYGDEFGYWAAGAYLAGLDWSDITALNEYYSWGYGLVLSLILRLPIDSVLSYQIAILINGVFLFISYLFSYKLVKEFLQEWNCVCQSLVAFVVVIFPSALYYTQYTLSEVFLCMIFWIVTYLQWKIIKDNLLKYEILIVLCCAMLMAIHLRTIGIVFFSFLTIIMSEIKRDKNKKAIITIIIIALIVFFVVSMIKDLYQSSYVLDYIELKNNNTISGQTKKLQSLFTIEGIVSFLANLIGRIYIFCINTFFFGVIGLVLGVKKIIDTRRNKKKLDKREIFFIIIALEILSLIAISAVYMITPKLTGFLTRFDVLTYSRYHDFVVGPLILLAIVYINKYIDDKFNKKIVSVIAGIAIILTKIVTSVQDFEIPTSHLFFNVPTICFWVKKIEDINIVYIIAMIASIVIFGMFLFLLKTKRQFGIMIFCVVIILMGIYGSHFVFKNACLNWSINETNLSLQAIEYVKKNNYEDKLKVFVDDNVLRMDSLQFLLKDYEIKAEVIDNIFNIQEDIIITTTNYKNNEKISDACFDIVFENKFIKMWKNNN